MSFNRIKYDNCATELATKQSVGYGDYRLQGNPNESCSSCMSFNGPRGAKSDVSLVKTNLNWGEMAQLESK